jgi:hypothetical protein
MTTAYWILDAESVLDTCAECEERKKCHTGK